MQALLLGYPSDWGEARSCEWGRRTYGGSSGGPVQAIFHFGIHRLFIRRWCLFLATPPPPATQVRSFSLPPGLAALVPGIGYHVPNLPPFTSFPSLLRARVASTMCPPPCVTIYTCPPLLPPGIYQVPPPPPLSPGSYHGHAGLEDEYGLQGAIVIHDNVKSPG